MDFIFFNSLVNILLCLIPYLCTLEGKEKDKTKSTK